MSNDRSKYHRVINGVDGREAMVDVYSVLEAFEVTCPARQHAIKKLLCAGLRGKGSVLDDLGGAALAIERAIQMEQARKPMRFGPIRINPSTGRAEAYEPPKPTCKDCLQVPPVKESLTTTTAKDSLVATDKGD